MRLRPLRFAAAALSLIGLTAFAPAASAEPHALPDSTVLDIWQLPNGLRVVIRHVPRAEYVAASVVWPFGADDDPQGQAGRADLLAELLMTSEAGDTPERTREELDGTWPGGWSAGASARLTRITAVPSRAQFPGALRELAQRVKGVTPSDSAVRRALAALRDDDRARRAPSSNAELYAAARQLGLGRYDPADLDQGLRALGRLKREELQKELRERFVPTGAVLSLAGNVGEMNLRALIQNEFGSIPAASPRPAPLPRELKPASLDLKRAGLATPVGTVAIIAPALDDSLHPSFYINALFLGSQAGSDWKQAPAPLSSRFQYSLFDEPELARFYPPVHPGTAADSALDTAFNDAVSAMGAMVFGPEAMDGLMRAVGWLLGGPMPIDLAVRARKDPGVLTTLATNQAARELWGGEPFWSEYRRQIGPHQLGGFHHWVGYLLDRSHKIKVLIHPAN